MTFIQSIVHPSSIIEHDPRRILVRGVNWLGDAVMTTPALQRLRERFPQAHIILLTHEKLADLWLHHPSINELLTFARSEGIWRVASKIRALSVLKGDSAFQAEDGNHLANYDLATQKPIYAKDGGIYERALVRPDRNNWAPRVGFAYRLMPKTVIRSGYGISYVHFNRLGGENLLAYNPPTVITTTINNPDMSSSASLRIEGALTEETP